MKSRTELGLNDWPIGKKEPALIFLVIIVLWLPFLATSCSLKQIDTAHYYLCIGIANYERVNGLIYPTLDATSMAELLSKRGWQAVPADAASPWQDGTLLDDKATKAHIKAAIVDGFAEIPTNATILIFFSGHGSYSGGISYLVPYDYSGSAAGAIGPAELYNWLAGLPTKNIIFISDSCFSGGFVDTQDSGDAIPASYQDATGNTALTVPGYAINNFGSLLAKNAQAAGQRAPVSISAAGAKEYSYEDSSSLKHGVFTYYLLQAAKEGDSNHDGFVTCTEAYSYVADCIDSYWNSEYEGDAAFYPHISGGARDLVLYCKSQDGG